jgi:signal transduction histidine kinase
MEKGAGESGMDLWREERTPTGLVLLPLGIVGIALIALVAIPPIITERNTELRREVVEIYSPLGRRISNLQRTTGSELAAARGYAMTGDPFFVDRFLGVNAYGDQLAREIDSLATRLGGDVASGSTRLLETRREWASANFGRTRSDFLAGLGEHQRYFDATMEAGERLQDGLQRVQQQQIQRIQDAERMRARVSIFLAVVALLGGVAALWLALRLVRSERRMLRRARNETALRRIAQVMTEAEDLPRALDQIVEAVRQVSGAESVQLVTVDEARTEVEVIASSGRASKGGRTSYAESDVRAVIEDAGQLTGPAAGSAGPAGGRVALGPRMRSLAVPLISERELLGALSLRRGGLARPFDNAEIYRSRLLADMAALVLRRLRLIEEMRIKESQLSVAADQLATLNSTLEERVRDRTRTVRKLARELSLAEQRERQEIAQMLHDDLQQMLYAVQLNAKMLESRARELGDDRIVSGLASVHDIATEALDSTRKLTADLSTPGREGMTLVDSLRWLGDHARERFGLEVDVRSTTGAAPSEDVRVLLFRVVRELVFNVVKHADTDRAVIEVEECDGQLAVTVSDEGVGMDLAAGERPGSGSTGFGLSRTAERLKLFDGHIDVESAPGRGTRIRVAVPCRHEMDA